jgi:hypothetical protein
MANDQDNPIRTAAAKIAKYVSDLAEMRVETLYVEVGADGAADFDQARPIAQTIIKLDADNKSIIPLRRTAEGGFEVDTVLLELHQRNVDTAIEYRARLLNTLLSSLQTLTSRQR